MVDLFRLRKITEISALNLVDFVKNQVEPRVRIGVTGLSRSGKTIFITALIKALTEGGRLPLFEAASSGRLALATFEPQPNDTIPRFAYEEHLAMIEGGIWAHSTKAISEIRLKLPFKSANGVSKTLLLDIVDYPGEWLLDLPLLDKDYATWSSETLALMEEEPRKSLSKNYRALLEDVNDEVTAKKLHISFVEYLKSCRAEGVSLSMLPPGRFLMAGELEGSPALTFVPLPFDNPMMQRRYESYKQQVVYPFFRDYFSRIDRQIILIDALSSLNAGLFALNDLENALTEILSALNFGKNNIFDFVFNRHIEKTIIAATKADHIHSSQHSRLEKIVSSLTEKAIIRAKANGTSINTMTIASLRSSHEALIKRGDIERACIIATPVDSEKEIAIYAGELPQNPLDLKQGFIGGDDYRFLRLSPPKTAGQKGAMPHIRLDKALELLLGDALK